MTVRQYGFVQVKQNITEIWIKRENNYYQGPDYDDLKSAKMT